MELFKELLIDVAIMRRRVSLCEYMIQLLGVSRMGNWYATNAAAACKTVDLPFAQVL